MLSQNQIRELARQNIIRAVYGKPELIKKSFLIISDQLVCVCDDPKLGVEYGPIKEKLSIGLYPKYIFTESDPKTASDYMVMYIGPVGGVGITILFFYFQKLELSTSFLFPKTQPKFEDVVYGWVIAGSNYTDYVLKKFKPTEAKLFNKVCINIHRELGYFYEQFIIKQPLGIPERFIMSIRKFVNDYIIDRWFTGFGGFKKGLDKNKKLSNKPLINIPNKPDYLCLHMESYPSSYENIVDLKKLVLRMIKSLGSKFKDEIETAKWSPGGIEYYKIKRSTKIGKKQS